MDINESRIEETIIYDKLTKPQENIPMFHGFMNNKQTIIDHTVIDIDQRIRQASEVPGLELTAVEESDRMGKKKTKMKEYLDWYMAPIIDRQNQYNKALLPIVGKLLELSNSEKDAIIMIQRTLEDTQVHGKTNLNIAREKNISHMLFHLGISQEEYIDVRTLSESILSKISLSDVSAKKAILIKKDMKLPVELEQQYIKYAEIEQDAIYVGREMLEEAAE